MLQTEQMADFVLEQDRIMLEAIPLEARQREKLLQVDIAIARLRRMLKVEATRQFEARSNPTRPNKNEMRWSRSSDELGR